nr:hypothetical protein [uncultured Sphaerochaeta sp.]
MKYSISERQKELHEECFGYGCVVDAYGCLCMELFNSRIAKMQKLAKALTWNNVEILNNFEVKKDPCLA